MALKAGYKGIKNNLLNKLKAMPFISTIGDGLILEDGELSATGGGGGGADLSVIAPTFSTETAYTAGEYVTHENKLYVFTTDHAAGAWNASDVTEKSVSDVLEADAADIAKTYKTNDDTESTIVDGDYIPFFDSSAASGVGAAKKSTWSNFKSKILSTIISAIGVNESGEKASVAYTIGDHFYKNGKYCTVIAAISQGSDLILNTNYKEGTIAEHPTYVKIAESGSNSDTLHNKISSISTAFEALTSAEKSESRLKIVPSDGAWEQIYSYTGNHRYSIIIDVQPTLFRVGAVDFVNMTFVTATGQASGITFGDSSSQIVTWNLIIELLN